MRQRTLTFGAIALLLALAVLFWWFRIFTHGNDPGIDMGVVDLYTEHIPTVSYAFDVLATGRIPLWNPYQFCGTPFLAMGWTGVFYPPRLITLVVDVLTAIEILLVFHLFLGGVGMWALARQLGLGTVGGLCAATTFLWSGWLTSNLTGPGIFEAITWMPVVVLMLDGVMLGRRLAWLGLIAALTCQLLLGLFEITLHTAYMGMLFVVCRAFQLARLGAWTMALRRTIAVAASAVTALLLSMPNTLPLIELVRQSVRISGSLSFFQTRILGIIAPEDFLRGAFERVSCTEVGTLPLVAFPLAVALRRNRAIWIASGITVVCAALLTFGGWAFRLYYEIPVVGSMFRRPMKFLDLYVFGQALLAGAAIVRLQGWVAERPRDLWRQPGWLGALLFGIVVLACLAWLEIMHWFSIVLLGLLVLFGIVRRPEARRAIVVGVCVVQAATLFFMTGGWHIRPVKRPEIFRNKDLVLAMITPTLGNARVYLSPKFASVPGLTPRQGTLRRMAVVDDYEPLATARYATFFDTVSRRDSPLVPFSGFYELAADSRWRLMDLTGTKYFVMHAREAGTRFMVTNTQEFRLMFSSGPIRVFERRTVLPRAYLVSRARVIDGLDDVLTALDTPGFDPRHEVILEPGGAGGEPPVVVPEPAARGEVNGEVSIISYAPERVVLTAQATAPGFLVLGDHFYPGWKAFVGEREVPIHRANYLFRAVRVEAGTSTVRFEFQPASFRAGVVIAAGTAVTMISVGFAAMVRRRRPRRDADDRLPPPLVECADGL